MFKNFEFEIKNHHKLSYFVIKTPKKYISWKILNMPFVRI
jgi:hypothetical protein